ncbi:YiiX/YebB-like N1pC/P60 family cysteine hydrolase [Hydrogenophaga sp.]|uniref:YiiX/YebB-like N1pC/P60 family cysteine hydrolase n=1 Tax=Hydrogenophaga sp. TaxID=1904254 RepID=UPI002736F1A2|nr:YiiX/YebB-like N1pC/P60 family cysteine hydrolase [Hydrogenophaga sp.]MDP1959964.1 YiiX/YebB-like N1pC/P60 family cysteine hydrolase [Methylotenera sp.]MDP3887927.1 YiiX/YebB-like N1pC/P60 family cysteine hydrolase [Hydrogenophaga sp.]
MEALLKKITPKLVIFFLVTLFIIFTYVFFKINSQTKTYHLAANKRENYRSYSQLLNGDIVFRVGTGFWTPIFVKANKRNGFSHLGVVIFEDQIPYVLHAEADDLAIKGGIKKTPLDIFISDSYSYVFKKNNMPHDLKENFIFELKKLFNLNIDFDSQFDILDNGEKVYCSEFIWLAAKKAGSDNFGKIEFLFGKPFVLVDSIFESQFLGNIYKLN